MSGQGETSPAGLADDPLWYKDAIVYQTHVKAFYDTDGDGIGDFAGLTGRLDYIRDLGANAIWLLPFYPSPMRDDGYDIADYRNIHRPYGTRRDFRRFVRAAHRRGIRVIIELVVNHTSDQHPWFQAARRAPKGSRKRDYYVWSDDDRRFAGTRIIFTDSESSNWAWDPIAQQYYWHRFFSHQPDLNHNNSQVVRAVIRVMRFWLDQGVDGLRLDAIPYLCVREGTDNENLPETHAVIKRMRTEIDAHYRNRMLLAEANQWPEDVRDYFGEGDECHVAYHFPLMPRMFMALAQEQRHPIVEILEQTPEIPPSCQWAIFLRNHDELTLEMVSDRERDYMYRMFAADPRMRLNLGIRRRLAPLLDNDRDKLRLMHSLLLSMPGCPILYYGDELGMGDNIYLGDRDSVRTPMQWSPDRNAGFSRADPQRLYLPPVMDPVYGYQAVNVEAESRGSASLLNWMRRIVAVRKAHPVFGRGGLALLAPGNRKILAYVREGGPGQGGESVLCVANLARGAQPVELDLARFKGRVPVELLGQTPFPPIGELPYLLTLPGYGFYWLLLSEEAQAPAWHEDRLPALKLLTLVIPEGLASLDPGRAQRRAPAARALARLESEVLPTYLPTRRWFPWGVGQTLKTSLAERQPWQDWLLTLVRVERAGESERRCFLPFGIVWEGRDPEPATGAQAAAALARVRRHGSQGILCDAFADESFLRALVRLVGQGGELPFGEGRLVFAPSSAFPDLAGPGGGGGLRPLADGGAIVDDRLLLKGYRLLEPGPSPEAELGLFLTERSPFARVLPLAGTLSFRQGDGSVATLALLEGHLPNQGDLRTMAVELLARLIDDHGDDLGRWDSDPAEASWEALVETMGRRLAELHQALARPGGGPAFDPEPIAPADLAAWRDAIAGEAQATLDALAGDPEVLPEPARPQAADLLERRQPLLDLIAALTPGRVAAVKTRCHGDLHLGRVLLAGQEPIFVDFDGDPGRPLAERRAKRCPLVDLAGLVHSIDSAARQALEGQTRVEPAERARLAVPLGRWSRGSSARLVAGYAETAAGPPIWPEPPGQADDLLRLFSLGQRLREVRLALRERAQGLAIALDGLLALLDSGPPRQT
jgi:maltose alpha-D-glucosyltransferase/alpha-amylase